jgi:hypothetical protein
MNEKQFDQEYPVDNSNMIQQIITNILTDTRTIFVDINPK